MAQQSNEGQQSTQSQYWESRAGNRQTANWLTAVVAISLTEHFNNDYMTKATEITADSSIYVKTHKAGKSIYIDIY